MKKLLIQMMKFINKGYELRKKTENNSACANRRVEWPNFAEFQHCFIVYYLSGASNMSAKKGAELLNAKEWGMPFLWPTMCKKVKHNFGRHSEFYFF